MAARLALLLALLCLAACDGLDHRQVRLCERVFAELEETADRMIRIGVEALAAPKGVPGVVLLLRDKDNAQASAQRFVCRFRGARFEEGQTELIGIVRLSGEELGYLALGHLRRRLGLGY